MNRGETWTDGQCLGFLRERYEDDRVGEYIETLVSGRKDFERLKEENTAYKSTFDEIMKLKDADGPKIAAALLMIASDWCSSVDIEMTLHPFTKGSEATDE